MAPVTGNTQRALSLSTKLSILDEVEKKLSSKTLIAKKYGIAKSTLSTILKAKDKIKNADGGGLSKGRKRLREAAHPTLENALIQWIKILRSKNIPIDGNMLKSKAEEFALRMDLGDSVKFSDGWLQKFKLRFDLSFRKVCGESGEANKQHASDWREKRLKEVLDHYEPRDIFNADETALFFKLLPNKTFAFKGEGCFGGKLSKQRITLLLGANMDGSEKLKPFVIGKFAKPRCFKGIRTLPAKYGHNNSAWMTATLFKEWLVELDNYFFGKKRNIILIIDNCSAHCKVDGLRAIKVEFLPPNLTSLIQPMDQGIIQCLKTNYRKAVLKRIVTCLESEKTYDINILGAIHIVCSSWDAVSAETVANCFRHAGFVKPNTPEVSVEATSESAKDNSEEKLLMDAVLNLTNGDQVSFDDYLHSDDNVECFEELTEEEIIKRAQIEAEKEIFSSDEEADSNIEEDPVVPKPTVKQAIQAIDTLRTYLQCLDNTEGTLKELMNVERTVYSNVVSSLQQKKITDFFQETL